MVVPGAGRELVFHGYRVPVLQDKKHSEMGGIDGCTRMRRYLMPLNCTLNNG